nr:MAG TPA: hypothetical protein [Caudoviricetes sp.]
MNQFQPVPSAYMPIQQPYPPYQQPYPQTPTRMVPQISGRVVNSLDDITVQEVPTDGTVALFPAADGKCIYSKRWTPDGNILTMRFVPEASEAQPKQPSQLDIIDNRISELFDMVERIEDRLPYDVETKRTATTRRKAVKANAAE